MIGIPPVNSGPEKLHDVTTLLAELQEDLTSRKLSDEERKGRLERLKVYGRDPTNADPIFTPEGIQTLFKQAFHDGSSIQASREALSCAANSLLLKDDTRKYLADMGIWGKMIERLKTGESHDEFLISRLLFVVTYESSVDFEKVYADFPLAETIQEKLMQHAKRYGKRSTSEPTTIPMDDNALTETSKLIFNSLFFKPALASKLTSSAPHLFAILGDSQADPPLKQPVASVLNALLNLDTAAPDWVNSAFPPNEPVSILVRLFALLSSSIKAYKGPELDRLLSPLLTLLTKMYNVAPSAELKGNFRQRLLPSDLDRAQVLGKGNSLPNRLLALSTAPVAQTSGEIISNLLFELSDADPAKFVHNVGFGYASGYLMRKGIPLPQGVGGGSSSGDINPITGQRRDQENETDLPEMTEEEKEREAERLFVLFERLKRTGVMDVRNPAEDASRFEELPD